MSDHPTTETMPAQPEAPEKAKLALSPAQVAGSLLASVSAAIVASYFGVAGTIIGTALISVIATVGSALYATGIRRTRSQLQQLRSTASRTEAQEAATRLQEAASPTNALLQPVGVPSPDPAPLPPEDTVGVRTGWQRVLRWPVIAGVVAIFVVAMGVVTAVELVAGSPLDHAIYSHGSSGGSSFSQVFSGGSSKPATPAPATPTSVPTPSTTRPSTSTTAPAATTTVAPSAATKPPSSTTTTIAPGSAATTTTVVGATTTSVASAG